MKARVDGGEIDIGIRGYSKDVAIEALKVFDQMFGYATYHIPIKLSDLSSSMINPDSVAGFEEVVIGHKMKKSKGSISKSF